MEQVKVIVSDKQIYEDHEEANEASFEAVLLEKEGTTYLNYKDKQQNVDTTIGFLGEVVSIKRQGNVSAYFEFNEKEPFHTSYQTLYGNLELTVVTKRIHKKLHFPSFMLTVSYELWMQDNKISDNIYSIYTRF